MLNLRKTTAVLGAAVLCFGFAGNQAQAQVTAPDYSCTDAVYGTGTTTYSTSIYTQCEANYTQNQNSAALTSVAVLRTAASQSARLVGNRISSAINGNSGFKMADNGFSASTGMSGGNGGHGAGAWVAGSYSDVSDDNSATAFDGEVYTAMVGADYRVNSHVLVGLAVGYENSDIDTSFNQNQVTGEDGNIDGDGYTIAPYLGVVLSDTAQLDVTLGYSDLEYDTTRFDPLTSNQITGSTDGERYFVNAGVSGQHVYRNNWNLRGRAGVFYASEDKDAFVETESNGATIAQSETNTDLGQFTLDAELGYAFNYFEPYVLAGAEFDFGKNDTAVGGNQTGSSLEDEDFGARFGGGINLNLGHNVTGGIEAYTVEFRDDYEEYTVTGGLRLNF